MYHAIQGVNALNHEMDFFLQKLKKSKIKTKTTIQNIYGVKIAKPFPLQILATVSCHFKNFQLRATIYRTLQFLVCVKRPCSSLIT